MTTELYPDDYFGGQDKFDPIIDHTNERRWLINEIIKPELPNIIDNVEKCLDMLHSDQIFKMPISNGTNGVDSSQSNDLPSIKGVITRQGGYVLDFQAVVRFKEFKKGRPTLYRMNTGRKYPLLQLESIIDNLTELLKMLEDLELVEDVQEFADTFGIVLKLLTASTQLLQNPPQELIFPYNNNYIMKQMFQDCQNICESTHHEISLELVLFKNEISIDFRNLAKVTKKPWSEIDPTTGKSITDKIKDQLKTDRDKSTTEILTENGVHIEQPSLLNNIMMSTFNTEATTLAEAQRFLSRCVTFDNKVVTELEKLAITTSDPSLISITSKLAALDGTISNHYINLTVEECIINN
ncbi:hypothetical protein NCAS_0C02800 [Naumovozyma castellii]|uniref:Uncharacterized protein n=1 Tax=Naumovozyma castellii TaxID=27288 RepID=G0VCR0_NAUCA|nr:hypothetical protein NCAS_0C02800 [Naumovozyma castellii CBS 4309]CCC69270.1 hypothetical protein NCAS_0C02800 [Naumovozyma castellii CBS 4309]